MANMKRTVIEINSDIEYIKDESTLYTHPKTGLPTAKGLYSNENTIKIRKLYKEALNNGWGWYDNSCTCYDKTDNKNSDEYDLLIQKKR